MAFSKRTRRLKIKKRVRGIVNGTSERPRLSVFRSNKEIYAQVIDDVKGLTLVSASSKDKEVAKTKGSKSEISVVVGKLLAERATKAGVKTVAFDRNGYLYHGRVKALADGAREGGLNF